MVEIMLKNHVVRLWILCSVFIFVVSPAIQNYFLVVLFLNLIKLNQQPHIKNNMLQTLLNQSLFKNVLLIELIEFTSFSLDLFGIIFPLNQFNLFHQSGWKKITVLYGIRGINRKVRFFFIYTGTYHKTDKIFK